MAAAVAAALATAIAAAAALALLGAGTAQARLPRAITLQWVGDIALRTQQGLPPGGLIHALAPVAGDLRDAELTAGNLEGTLSVGGTSKCGHLAAGRCFAFQAPPSVALELRSLGFRLVNQANNHSMDFGASGRAQTVAALDRAGIAHTGFPGEITYLRVHGVRVAFLGFAPYPYDADLLDIPAAETMVRAARRHAALVVVIIHAGAEGADQLHTPYGPQYYLGENRGDARGFAHAVIRAGASLVLGSGPHVIRGMERYDGRLIAYSLGNFVGYHTLGGGGVLDDSAILRVTLATAGQIPGARLAAGQVLAARWISVRLRGGLPRPDPTDNSAHLVRELSAQDFPGPSDHFSIAADGIFRLPLVGWGSFGRARPAS